MRNRTFSILATLVLLLTGLLTACGGTSSVTTASATPTAVIATDTPALPTPTATEAPTFTPTPIPTQAILSTPTAVAPPTDPSVSPGKLPSWTDWSGDESGFAKATLELVLKTAQPALRSSLRPLVDIHPMIIVNTASAPVCGQTVPQGVTIEFCDSAFQLIENQLASVASQSLPAADLQLLEAAADDLWQLNLSSSTEQQRECGAGWLAAVLISSGQTTKEYRDQIKEYLNSTTDFTLGYTGSTGGDMQTACQAA